LTDVPFDDGVDVAALAPVRVDGCAGMAPLRFNGCAGMAPLRFDFVGQTSYVCLGCDRVPAVR